MRENFHFLPSAQDSDFLFSMTLTARQGAVQKNGIFYTFVWSHHKDHLLPARERKDMYISMATMWDSPECCFTNVKTLPELTELKAYPDLSRKLNLFSDRQVDSCRVNENCGMLDVMDRV